MKSEIRNHEVDYDHVKDKIDKQLSTLLRQTQTEGNDSDDEQLGVFLKCNFLYFSFLLLRYVFLAPIIILDY